MGERTQAERIHALEVQVIDCKDEIKALAGKIDSLLELKHKGMGAFWIASIFIGAVFTGIVTFVTEWIK